MEDKLPTTIAELAKYVDGRFDAMEKKWDSKFTHLDLKFWSTLVSFVGISLTLSLVAVFK